MQRAQELVKQEGALAAFIWRYEPDVTELAEPKAASTSAESIALAKNLKKTGLEIRWPDHSLYAFMQAMGLVNDHVEGCVIRCEVEHARRSFKRPKG